MRKEKFLNTVVKDIICKNIGDKEKYKELDLLSDDIEMAKGILAGKFKYCPECDDYYLYKSYLTESETKNARICIYQDPINSGGNDYANGFVDITYSICPKGHKHEVSRKERTR